MTAMTSPALEPAEFYYIHDGRGECEYIYNSRQVEAYPEATTRLAREIARRRMAVDPDWTPYESLPTYFDLPNVEIGPDLVLAATAFEASRPHALPHHDVVRNPSEGHTVAYYEIVSAQWKGAIESLEPGVHQFFPHELRFADGVIPDRFIFRCRTHIDTVTGNYRLDDVLDVWSDVVGYRFVVDDTFGVPTLDREQVADRHFVYCAAMGARYVSHALAEKLLPLLPERTALLPVKLSAADPQRFPAVSPAGAGDGRKEAATTPSGKRKSAEPSAPGSLDPKIASAIAVLNNPHALDEGPLDKAQSLLERRLAKATVAQLFDFMAEALKSDIPLRRNAAFRVGFVACHERPEDELFTLCRTWAADPSPLKRVAVAHVLAREIAEDEDPNPETLAILTGLLDDRDPNVVAQTIGIVAGISHPACTQLLRSRRDKLAGHESAKVREMWHAQMESEEERPAVPEFPGEDVETLFASAFEAMRANGDFDARLEALRHRDAAAVAAIAARWAEDANPDKRKLAALALERPAGDETPPPKAVTDLLNKLSGDSDSAVAEAAVKALSAVRGGRPVSSEDLAALEPIGAHPSVAARAAYVDSLAFAETPEALDALLALADDPSEEVRTSVALHLDNYVEDSKGKRRERLRETLAVMVSDPSDLVRCNAIDALTKFNDPRAVDAIVRQLERPDEALESLDLLGAILERPNSRYLPGLERIKKEFPDDSDLDDAIRACRAKRRSKKG